jgi:hypothetical protein
MPIRNWVHYLFGKGWSSSTSLPQAASVGLQVGLVFMAVVSLNPYFIWEHQKLYYAIATLILLVSYAGCLRSLTLTRENLFLPVAFSLFLIYISILPKVHGGTTRWFFLIPFTVALLTVRQEELQKIFEKFYWVFALSLVPGIIVWICLVAGLPLEFQLLPPQNVLFAKAGVYYLQLPGVLFISSNVTLLPNGGLLARLCGPYDEPGTVGTVAALCLAATRFKFRDLRSVILLVAGLMSFSIAFATLTLIGCVATLVTARRSWLLVPALLCGVVGAFTLSGWHWYSTSSNVAKIRVIVPAEWYNKRNQIILCISDHSTPLQIENNAQSNTEERAAQTAPDIRSSELRERFAVCDEWRLRQQTVFDNRSTPEMDRLYASYVHSPVKTLLFGIASDASLVYGGTSSVWTSILTNYGIIGFAWLFLIFFAPLVQLWRKGELNLSILIFCALFVMSFYQRPVIWLPAQLLLYFVGLYYFESSYSQLKPAHNDPPAIHAGYP